MKKKAIFFLLSLLKATMLYDSYSSFANKPHTPCFTLIEQALSAFLTLIMFNEPWILPDVVYVIDFTFFHEGEYDS